MMNVRKVRMAVREWIMLVSMRVRLGAVPGKIVLMAMMLVMSVGVNMPQHLVPVQMAMAFREMQHDAGRHQYRCDPEKCIRRFAKQREKARRDWRLRFVLWYRDRRRS